MAIIPARSGSKGLKDKNVRLLCGKPLMAYTIGQALDSKAFDRIIVSTDSEEYAGIARKYGAEVPFLRSAATSSDTAGSWDVVREVIGRLETELSGSGQYCRIGEIMLLQATSPLRGTEDILASIDEMKEKRANAIVSVVEEEHSPLWSDVLPEDLCMDHFTENSGSVKLPRQFLPQYYRLNGAIYLIRRDELDKKDMFKDRCYAYIMPRERSVDIDTEMDFQFAEFLLRTGKTV